MLPEKKTKDIYIYRLQNIRLNNCNKSNFELNLAFKKHDIKSIFAFINEIRTFLTS